MTSKSQEGIQAESSTFILEIRIRNMSWQNIIEMEATWKEFTCSFVHMIYTLCEYMYFFRFLYKFYSSFCEASNLSHFHQFCELFSCSFIQQPCYLLDLMAKIKNIFFSFYTFILYINSVLVSFTNYSLHFDNFLPRHVSYLYRFLMQCLW